MVAVPKDALRRFIKACNPDEPLGIADEARYVAFDEGTPVRGSDHQSCIEALFEVVDSAEPQEETCQLFSGFSGSGKTTELYRLKKRFDEAGDTPTHCVYVDFEKYLDRYVPVSVSDVLRVLASALDEEATRAEGKDPAASAGYLKRFYEFIRHTDVELKSVAFEVYGAKLPLELRDNPSFRKRVEKVLAERFQQFATEAVDAMSDAVVRIRKATGKVRVVLLGDSLEKLTPLRDADRETLERSVESLFVQHANYLRVPCHAIYTFPLWLRFRSAELGGRYDGEPQILPMVKVAEKNGLPWEDGLARLAQVLEKRIDLPVIFGDDLPSTLRPLLAASGGYPRDLLRMTRNLLRSARSFPVSVESVNSVIDRLAEQYGFLVRAPDLAILKTVRDTHRLPDGDARSVAAFGRLVERFLVLAYRNGHEWYDVHPLVLRAAGVGERIDHPPALDENVQAVPIDQGDSTRLADPDVP